MPKSESIYSEEITEKYYETIGKDAEGGENKTEADKYFESLIPESFEGKTVLDHGCGNGRYSELFCQRGAKEVLGIDLSRSMVQKAKERKEEKDLRRFEVVNGDINNLPAFERKFDIVFSRFSLVYSTDIKKSDA
ncbi:MAG: methyltransferase domain-containing protein [Candidatus Moranbacteria bacterium]|nr:methyltransferase domain-containing protein [Candidatus Moranbacteria bacterium]